MRRSFINERLREAEKVLSDYRIALPPFAAYTVDDWAERSEEGELIRKWGLGWDLTDFGKEDYRKCGLLLFTLRNGILGDPESTTYAQKLLLIGEGQVTPMHFHWNKTEDIINQGGGIMVMKLYMATDDDELSDEGFSLVVDGVRRKFSPGDIIELPPGSSITLTPRIYHSFWAKEGHGMVIGGEVSSVNDDDTDNRFYEPLPRYPEIIEDEEPYRLMVKDY